MHNIQHHQTSAQDDHTHLFLSASFHSRKIDIVLLNDTWVERVEVHHEDVRIPQTPLGLKDETTLVLVPSLLATRFALGVVITVGDFLRLVTTK